MNSLNFNEWQEQIQYMQQRLAQLQQSADQLPLEQQPQEIIAQAFQELSNTIEKLQQMELELRQASAYFQLATSAVGCIIFDWNIDTHTVDRTQGLVEVLGYRPEEAECTPEWWTERIHPDDRQRVRNEVSEALSNRSDFAIEYQVRHKNNQYLYVLDKGLIVRNTKGKAVRVVGSTLNITADKQAEMALRENEQRLSGIATNIPGTVYRAVLHPDGTMSLPYINVGFRELTGLEPNEVMAQPERLLTIIHPDDRGQFDQVLTQKYQTLEPVEHEFRVITPSGQVKWFHDSARYFQMDNGDVVVDGVTLDISDRKQAEEVLQRLNEQLENRVRERTAELEQLNEILLVEVALRARAEATLHRREQEFKALVENAPDIITRFDRELRHVYVNPAIELATGLPAREFIGKTHHELGMPSELASFWGESLQTVFQTDSEQQIEFNLLTPNGLKYYQSRHVPEFGADGSTETVLAIARDITTSKQAEVEIRLSEQRFRTSVENMLDCFGIYSAVRDHSGKIIDFKVEYVNAAACENNRMTKEEMIGKSLCELLPNHRGTGLFDEYCQVVETDNSLIKEDLFYEDVFGQERLTRAFDIRVTKLDDGFTAAWRDVTLRKQAEDALRESEERFRQLAENINKVFWMSSFDSSEIIYVSPAYEQMWGRTRESLYEQPRSWLDAIHPEDRDRIEAAIEKQVQAEYDKEYRIVRPDGSMRWIRDRGFPVQNTQGQVYRVAGLAEDITSRKQVEEEIYKTLQKERELGELKSQFVSMTSHEFRTPLTTIQSSTELLERYRDRWSQEKQQTHFDRIQTAVDRMTQMLDDILILGKAEAGKLEFNPAPLDLVEFCRNLVEELQLTTENPNTIVLTCQRQSIPTSMDEKLLRQILTNLLSNAIKYSPSDSTVEFNLTYVDDSAIFQIQDQGIGIPPEDQPRLFNSFHRATNVGTIQGTGLGLAIVKQCLDLHKGEISVESEAGKGTTFTVILPLSN
ncbi:MAG TPA: PAS domain-containing protein [Coleofasciculaceae cyanobacterium]|jgi:PAS domain S-box-containing protein